MSSESEDQAVQNEEPVSLVINAAQKERNGGEDHDEDFLTVTDESLDGSDGEPRKAQKRKSKGQIIMRLGLNGFVENSGQLWSFPIELCRTWKGLLELIKDAFRLDVWINPLIKRQRFRIDSEDGYILPQAWESACKPDMQIILVVEAVAPPRFTSVFKFPRKGASTRAHQQWSEESDAMSGAEWDSDVSDGDGVKNQHLQSRKEWKEVSTLKKPSILKEASTSKERSEPMTNDPKVRYTFKYYELSADYTVGKTFLYEQSFDKQVGFQLQEREISADGKSKPILEEVTNVIRQKVSVKEDTDYRKGPSRHRPPPPLPPPPGYGFNSMANDNERPTRPEWANPDAKKPTMEADDYIESKTLIIRSSYLMNALRAVIKCTAIQERSGDVLKTGRFPLPYKDLYHHRDDLRAYKDSEYLKSRHPSNWIEDTREHIEILLDFLYSQKNVHLDVAEELWAQKTPQTTFELFWLLFKPGSDVYGRLDDSDRFSAYVVESISGGPTWESKTRSLTAYWIKLWNLSFDGSVIRREMERIFIPVFDGECDVTSLPVFPCHFYQEKADRPSLRESLIARGTKYTELVKGPAFREYTGIGASRERKSYDRARAVVVARSPLAIRANELADEGEDDVKSASYASSGGRGGRPGRGDRVPGCNCEKCKVYNVENQVFAHLPFENYDNIEPKGLTAPTEHQYFLCESHIFAFMLKDRAWDSIEVAGIVEPTFGVQAIDRLVMKSPTNKTVIKALCKAYTSSDGQHKPFYADNIEGKGEGQIILLHGPPGTGKTLTAESVAEFTKRPLLSITAADLGHASEDVEQNLNRFFRLATTWGAIVLLDEADVYLERRSTNDLTRNSVVSILLRSFDYFKGILFLTTNRVGTFDEAFLSRIHLSIGYDPLDDDARKEIWNNNFKKLDEDHQQGGRLIKYDYDAKEYVRRSQEVRELRLNGREIRNAFQTAVALALEDQPTSEGVPILREAHLAQVVTMARAFKAYMRSVRQNVDDSQIAFLEGLRDDQKKNYD